MEFKNNYVRLCQDVRYRGPVPEVVRHVKDNVLAVDVDEFLGVRSFSLMETYLTGHIGRACSSDHGIRQRQEFGSN